MGKRIDPEGDGLGEGGGGAEAEDVFAEGAVGGDLEFYFEACGGFGCGLEGSGR